MINFHQLSTFVAVISEGSMTAAADKLYLTQSAVSQQIRNLEEDLGVELLVRGVRSIRATPQGEILFEHARRILMQVQNAEATVKSLGAELKGELKMATLSSIGLHLLSPIIGRLLKFNQDLSVRLEYGSGPEILKAFKKNQLDVILLPDTQQEFALDLDPSIEKRNLGKEQMWLIGSGKDVELPKDINVSQLKSFPFVQLQGEFPGFDRSLNGALERAEVKPKVIFSSSNVGTIKRVIESGLGWGFLPGSSVRKQVRSGRLSRVHIRDLEYEVDVNFYYRSSTENKILCETLYQALLQQEKLAL